MARVGKNVLLLSLSLSLSLFLGHFENLALTKKTVPAFKTAALIRVKSRRTNYFL